MRIFEGAAFPYCRKKNRVCKLDDNSENGINLEMRNVLHRIFIENGVSKITTMHDSFDKKVYPLMKDNQYDTFEDVIGNLCDAHANVDSHNEDAPSTADTPQFPPAMKNDCDQDEDGLLFG